MKTIKILSAFLFMCFGAFSQQSTDYPAFWRLTGISGEVKLEGLYKEQELKRDYLSDHETSYSLGGGILLNTHSYFWHPNFLLVDASVEYSPQQNKDNYESIPYDQGEVRTMKRFDLHTTLFQNRFISLSNFADFSQTFSRRENLSDIRTDSKSWGGVISLKTKILPSSISYQQGKTDQHELQTQRQFNYANSFLEERTSQSFARHDKIEFIYSHTEFRRIQQMELVPDTVKNKIDDFVLNAELFFDRKQKSRFYSMIETADQKGYDSLKRKQAFESISFKLPANFELIGNYNYYDIDRRIQSINQQTTRGMLRHKLYESLNSDIFYEYTHADQTTFSQQDTRKGIDLDYTKKIPTGQLNLSYHYLLQNQVKQGDASTMQIIHEEYVLVDGQIILLKLPNVIISSVIVRDASGFPYQLTVDYDLIPHGNFIEIRRNQNGHIINNSSVFLDYTAVIPGNYQYDMKCESWSAGITLFQQLIGLYYRHVNQDFFNLENTEFLSLNYFTQKVYGCRLEYHALTGGLEYDDNNSSILPYKLKRYWVNFQQQYKQKILISLNGSMSEYHLVNENINQQFLDISGQFAYNFSGRSKVNFDMGYRQQTGQGIDLHLVNARLEFSTLLRQLKLTAGLQSYRRNYMEEIDNYNGAYFRISRRF